MSKYKWYQRFESIQSSMTFSFVVLIAGVLGLSSLLSFYFVQQSNRESAVFYTKEIISQMSHNIEYYTREMESVTRSITTNYDTLRYFNDDEHMTELQRELIRDRVVNQLSSLLDSRKDITSAALFGSNGQVISYNDKPIRSYTDFTRSDWYKGASENGGRPYITGSYVQNIYEDQYPWVVSMSSMMYDSFSKSSIGIMVLDMNYATINEICSGVSLGDQGYVYILDRDGAVVWHPKQQLVHSNLYKELLTEIIGREDGIYEEEVNGADKVYIVETSDSTGWRIVAVMDGKEMVQNLDQLSALFILIAVISILTSFFIARTISATLSRPIRRLKKSMLEVQKGNLDEEVRIDNRNEIGDLSHTFNAMTNEIKELLDANFKAQRLKRKSEFKALQAQINPHFLYNTLDSIIWMSLANKKDEVVEMTSALAKLFRLSINKGDELITIQGEVDHVTNYLKIQKYRYESKLSYDIHLEPSVKNYWTQKLILQPLVENAIYHGIKLKAEGGHINVMIFEDEDTLVMRVSDNGIGMDEQRLGDVRALNTSSKSGVGTKNVIERLKLVYGDKVDIEFESKLEVGTSVTIRIPTELMEVDSDETHKNY